MSANTQGLNLNQIISRLILAIIWLSLPIGFFLGLPEKIIVPVIIFTGFTFFSHSCLAYIFADMIVDKKRWRGYLQILLFGPTEIDRLKKINKTKIPPLPSQ